MTDDFGILKECPGTDTDLKIKGVVLFFEIEKGINEIDKLKPVSLLPITSGMKFVSGALGVVKAFSLAARLAKGFGSLVRKCLPIFRK